MLHPDDTWGILLAPILQARWTESLPATNTQKFRVEHINIFQILLNGQMISQERTGNTPGPKTKQQSNKFMSSRQYCTKAHCPLRHSLPPETGGRVSQMKRELVLRSLQKSRTPRKTMHQEHKKTPHPSTRKNFLSQPGPWMREHLP